MKTVHLMDEPQAVTTDKPEFAINYTPQAVDIEIGNVKIRGAGAKVAGNTELTIDGVKLRGVTRVELIGDCKDVWRLVVHMIPGLAK